MFKSKMDCEKKKKVDLRSNLGKVVSYRCYGKPRTIRIISAMKLVSLIKKGNPLFLCNVRGLERKAKAMPEEIVGSE